MKTPKTFEEWRQSLVDPEMMSPTEQMCAKGAWDACEDAHKRRLEAADTLAKKCEQLLKPSGPIGEWQAQTEWRDAVNDYWMARWSQRCPSIS